MFGFQKLATLIADLSRTVKGGDLIVADEIFTVLDLYVIQLQKQFN